MKTKTIAIALLLMAALVVSARDRKCFDEGWRFRLADNDSLALPSYNDSSWRLLDLPHDWSIEGDFSPSNPSGNTGGALPGGVGWYRKHFSTDVRKGGNRRLYVDFDGVYMNSTVYVNGQKLGTRPYGYSSFRYEITPYLNDNGQNVIAVKVDNKLQPNGRWYTGCGIYRHVWLAETAPVAVAHWGTYVTTTLKGRNKAVVEIETTLDNATSRAVDATVRNTIIDRQGRSVASTSKQVKASDSTVVAQRLTIKNPVMWSTSNPYVYKVKTEVLVDGKVADTYYTTTGVRSFRFDAKTGFWLNGKNMKINGVCQHHDLGCLGAALNEDALYRQLKMLKDMGCNAIRTSHNPPAPELLAMCDTMGLIVQDESFDMWRRKKTKYDYAQFFDKWHERDLRDMLRRDRNHPSILMWSIGNEVLEQWSSAEADTLTAEQANLILNFGHDASMLAHDSQMSVNSLLTKHLVEIVKSMDKTRPVTAGCNEPNPNNHLFKSGALDLIGFNYHEAWIKDVPKNFPGKPFIMTESVSALATRGFYSMPSDSTTMAPDRWDIPYTDPIYMRSSYDNSCVPWGSTHETTWDVVKHTPWCSGQFIWTGWDYIGEPTPYPYPARSSYFGIIDLAGFPKDAYYMYQSEWADKQILHLFPHWNWLPGQDIDMWCYYNNADEVELFVNGKSQGARRKADSHQYHVMWRVKFEPGEVKAVARKDGKVIASQARHTAGPAAALRLTPDRTVMSADGKSLAFVTVEVVDKDGNLCPRADNQVFFDVAGRATIAGVDNGSQTSLERFKDNKRHCLNGKCLVVLRSAKNAGKAVLTARSFDLKDASTSITVR